MLRVIVDGKPVEVEPGTTIAGAARRLGIRIPILCYVEGVSSSASCMVCAVRIEGRPNFSPACATQVADGMVVHASSPEVRQARRMALEMILSYHTGDCIAPCRTGCPARLDIPGFTARIAAGDPRGAAEIVTDALTLPASLGRVCPHFCEQRCRRQDREGSLSIRSLHRFCADHDLASAAPYVPSKAAPTGKRAAIVGAGPAGLTAAMHLLRKGHHVVIFDANAQPGGMLRYSIPEFRLPRAVLDAEIDTIRKLGAEFRMNQRLGRDLTLEGLRRDFDAVFLAIGAQGTRGLGCPGEEMATSAIEFLAQVADGKRPAIGGEVIILGGGNTAMDASRTAVRLGAKSVRVFYRRTRREMPCLMDEVAAAEAEGVRIEFLVAPTRLEKQDGKLRLTCQRMELGAPDESGRRRPVPIAGSEFAVEASCVIGAVGQTVDVGEESAPGLVLSKWGIAADAHTLATNLKGVFAGGDAVSGPEMAIRAVASGKLAAASMDQYLAGQEVVGALERINILMGKLDEEELAALFRQIEESPRAPMEELALEQRRRSFEEVEKGLAADVAVREAQRCMSCGCSKATSCRLRDFATEYNVDPLRFRGEKRKFDRDTSHPEVAYEPGKCILCGVCVKVAAQEGEEVGLVMVERGFDSTVEVPLGKTMAEGLKKSGRRVAELCPTGAIALKGPVCADCVKR
jgi:formate dehydrogenase major subunit